MKCFPGVARIFSDNCACVLGLIPAVLYGHISYFGIKQNTSVDELELIFEYISRSDIENAVKVLEKASLIEIKHDVIIYKEEI